jgi:uncharacterized membrane protein YjgN (DUF898 family)
MSVQDAPTPIMGAQTGMAAKFIGLNGGYWRLLIQGNALVALTLGIYRFWLTTDMRRFLWSNTEIDGESFEYTGRGIELFLGFLIAIAVLVPIYVVVIGASFLIKGLEDFAATILFLVLFVLGQYAIYRARRYRLTRTVFRGVRLHQSGSAWVYAVRSVGWWVLILLSLGIAYPWAQANLERYRMRHTFYGDMPGRFVGSGTSLFLRGIILWLILLGPVFIGLFRISAADWVSLATQIVASAQSGGKSIPLIGSAAKFLAFAPSWIIIVGLIMYPAFEAMTMRWWLSGLRFGEIGVTSTLRTGSIYWIYVKYLLAVLALLVVAVGVMAVGAGLLWAAVGTMQKSAAAQTVGVVFGVIFYVVFLLALSTLYQAIVKLSIWRASIASLDISNFHMVELVKADGRESSPFGEGLADALNVGSF